MRLGGRRGSGMELPPGTSDADMARYMRSQGMQLPGARGGPEDTMRAMMSGGGGRGGGPGEYGGFFGMPRGASSMAPFASNPSNEFGMTREPERGAGGMWPPEQRPTGGLDSLGVGGPMTQGMFDRPTGGRDRDADTRLFDRSAGGDHMFPASYPPTKQSPIPVQQQQQQWEPSMEKSADENRVSVESKPRVVRFADEEPPKQMKPPAVPSTNAHDLSEAKVCSVCEHSERGNAGVSPCSFFSTFTLLVLYSGFISLFIQR